MEQRVVVGVGHLPISCIEVDLGSAVSLVLYTFPSNTGRKTLLSDNLLQSLLEGTQPKQTTKEISDRSTHHQLKL
jgi:hypothetical protein